MQAKSDGLASFLQPSSATLSTGLHESHAVQSQMAYRLATKGALTVGFNGEKFRGKVTFPAFNLEMKGLSALSSTFAFREVSFRECHMGSGHNFFRMGTYRSLRIRH